MSRLTIRKYGEIVSNKREKKEIHCSNFCNNCSQGSGNCEYVKDMIEKLAEYEDLEEKGLLVKLPCKIGSTIYQLINSHINEYKVIGICFDIFQNKWMYEVTYEIGLEWFKTMCDFDVFGKTVFLTKEEAEQELKRLESAE